MRYLCRLVTPPAGVILDPFCGSGTTCIAAVLEGFSYIGIDQDAHYCEIAERRIAYWREHPEGPVYEADVPVNENQMGLFAGIS